MAGNLPKTNWADVDFWIIFLGLIIIYLVVAWLCNWAPLYDNYWELDPM